MSDPLRDTGTGTQAPVNREVYPPSTRGHHAYPCYASRAKPGGETACRGCLHWLAAAIAAAWCALAAGAAGAAQTPPDAPQRERAITALHQLQGAAVPGKSPVVAAYQARTVPCAEGQLGAVERPSRGRGRWSCTRRHQRFCF